MPWHELKLLKWKQDESKPIEKPKMSTATTLTTMSDLNNVEQQRSNSKTSKNVTKKKQRRNLLLGKLSDDLDYLEGLLTDVQLAEPEEDESAENRSSNRPNNKSVHLKRAAEDAISFLNNRQEFWSQFKPVYSKQ